MRSPSLVLHADWSKAPKKRWLAEAVLDATGRYRVGAPALVGPTDELVERLVVLDGGVFAGFDFPIGLPVRYAEAVGVTSFRGLLPALGADAWADFYEVCEEAADVSLARPFFPQRVRKGVTREPVLRLFGASSMAELLRTCEQRTADRGDACALFWTLGGNQVGKAAIAGWREVVAPALDYEGVALWPFDGDLDVLLLSSRAVIAETYPREFYGHLGVRLDGSKRAQATRRAAAMAIDGWLSLPDVAARVELTDEARHALNDGFGSRAWGEDAFDAFVGVLGMLNVVLGRRLSLPERLPMSVRQVEGWILGQGGDLSSQRAGGR